VLAGLLEVGLGLIDLSFGLLFFVVGQLAVLLLGGTGDLLGRILDLVIETHGI
jgi:hypothetical protein